MPAVTPIGSFTATMRRSAAKVGIVSPVHALALLANHS